MCGRYLFLNEKKTKLNELAELAEKNMKPDTFSKISLHEVFPGSVSFAGIYDPEKQRHRTVTMQWGFAGKNGRLIINARSETCFTSPFFQGCHPCVLPATAYYEWNSEKQKYEFITGDVFYLCGLCRRESDGSLHYVIVTEDANADTSLIHPRQPVIFTYENAKAWCSRGTPSLIENHTDLKRYFQKA